MNASSGQIEFWKIWTDVGLIAIIAVPIGVFYLLPDQRLRCVYYLKVFTLITTIMNLTKLAYADARPYWASAEITAYKCSN